MATFSTPTTASADADAHDRAARRLQAWAARHPDAAALAALASLAVRIDSALLRRLRLQLLPRAEPGTEADVWFSGLHESRGRDGVVLDAGVQRLLRARLALLPAGDGGVRPLDAAWRITAALHADAPEAIRTEEALTWEALRPASKDGDDLPERIDALLAPALAAMAGGTEARALEVARWAQRAVPRLPDAARQHPSALALWLAALMRLGLPASRLPDTGEAGLPPALQWLLPKGQVNALQQVAVVPFDDALVLRPLADDAPAPVNEISLPRTKPLLLAVRVDGDDATGAPLLQRTVALEAAAGETRLPLPDGWRSLALNSLSGERWRLQRQSGEVPTDDAPLPLPWQRMRVLVMGASGPVGMGTFVSPTEVVTVVDVLDTRLLEDARDGGPVAASMPVLLEGCNADGDLHTLQAHVSAVDLRSALVLLTLQQPFADAMVASHLAGRPEPGAPAWTVPSIGSDGGRVDGTVSATPLTGDLPPGRAAPDALSMHFGMAAQHGTPPLPGMAGAPVFVGSTLAGIVDLGSTQGRSEVLWAVPAPAVDRFLDWARQAEPEWSRILLHHPADDPYGKGAEMDDQAVMRITVAAGRARVRLLEREAAQAHRTAVDDPKDPVYAAGLAGVVRLVTPVTADGTSAASRLRLLAVAARRWANPDFGFLNLGFRRNTERTPLPPVLAGVPLQDIGQLDDEALARALLVQTDAARSTAKPAATMLALREQLDQATRPFRPSEHALAQVRDALDRRDLPAVAELVVGRWNASSRLDAAPLVDLLAQLALPLPAVRHDNLPEEWDEDDYPHTLPDALADDLMDHLMGALHEAPRGAWAINAVPVQFGRLLIARAHASNRAPPCILVRAQDWDGPHSVDLIERQAMEAMMSALDCELAAVKTLFKRLDVPVWILVTTRPLPDKNTLLQLELRLPSARFLFLAGQQPDLADTARAIGAKPLPMIEPGADMVWLQGYKRLMEWARPRPKSKAIKATKPTRATPRKPLRK